MTGYVMGFTVSVLRFGASVVILGVLAGLPLQAKGALALGQACSTDTQCGSARCDAAPGNPRKCIPNDGTGKTGDYCSHHNHCGSRLCVNNACRATLALGAACTQNFDCGSGRCDTAAEVPHACIPNDNTGQAGAYCTHDNQCNGKLLCWDERGSVFYMPRRGTCGPPKLELGEECHVGGLRDAKNPCKTGRCDSNSNNCIPNDGTGQVGNYCTHNNHCASKLCVQSKCIAGGVTQLGKSCSTNTQCESGRCDAAPGHPRRCIPNDGTGRIGDYCSHNNHCRGGYRCALQTGAVYGSCRR